MRRNDNLVDLEKMLKISILIHIFETIFYYFAYLVAKICADTAENELSKV